MSSRSRREQPRQVSRRPTPPPRQLSGIEAASIVKFAYFTDEPPTPGTLLYTAFRRNMPRELKEVTIRNPVTFFYGIQQTGGLLNIQVRWINPDGALARTSDQPMDQSREGALWTWQVDRLEQRDLAQSGVWVTELIVSGHRVGRYPLLVHPLGR